MQMKCVLNLIELFFLNFARVSFTEEPRPRRCLWSCLKYELGDAKWPTGWPDVKSGTTIKDRKKCILKNMYLKVFKYIFFRHPLF